MRKLINYSMFHGKKQCTENCLVKISKNLQKCSDKNFKEIIELTLIFSTFLFKVNTARNSNYTKSNKKKAFNIIKTNKARMYLAIKHLIQTVNNKKSTQYYKNFYTELMLLLKNENHFVKKTGLQEQVFLNKHIFSYYRWR